LIIDGHRLGRCSRRMKSKSERMRRDGPKKSNAVNEAVCQTYWIRLLEGQIAASNLVQRVWISSCRVIAGALESLSKAILGRKAHSDKLAYLLHEHKHVWYHIINRTNHERTGNLKHLAVGMLSIAATSRSSFRTSIDLASCLGTFSTSFCAKNCIHVWMCSLVRIKQTRLYVISSWSIQ